MVLKTYNGFNHGQRMRGYRWLQGEYAAGRRQRPVRCDACGQDEGPIEAHSEDYSEPFGDHIGRHGLCYRCRMMIHNRFKHPAAWQAYKRDVREGRIFHPIGKSFPRFCQETLTRKGEDVPFRQGPVRERTLLDELR